MTTIRKQLSLLAITFFAATSPASPQENQPSSDSMKIPIQAAGDSAKRVAPEFPGFTKIESSKRRAVNVGVGPSFATEIHVSIVEQIPESLECSEILARAQWRQDILLAFDAKAHFDNCQFEAATNYILQEVDEAQSSGEKNDRDGALSALGRALHAIQDFYSHTNYVELAADSYPNLSDVPILHVWTTDGKGELLKQAQDRLYSGKVWWEPGSACKEPIKSHEELNNDGPDSLSGKQVIQKWNVSRYQAARDLARRATFEFMRESFAKPQLTGVATQCHGQLGVLILTDNRDHK